ncbi:hypothetical protein [Amycolatopsis magusensis]|uniref:WXG100 family type VII secretion target n=1 Tax=Amycolatopsis magusensis TaxID=882444 RepID=A0ABS4Q0P5_9PSEU|nr:hypothetical protein [Amycolatopsis magusensis]MBP2184730.1 hypothetical protein [Amycolatopsis magusensis]
MIGYWNVREWQPDPLDDAEQTLKKRGDQVLALADELKAAATPPGWFGPAADSAKEGLAAFTDRLEHQVAEVNAVRTGLMACADGMAALRTAVETVETLARKHQMTVTDAGEVDDAGWACGPKDDLKAVMAERAEMKAELKDRVRRILDFARQLDDDLAGLLDKTGQGKIGDGGATTLAAAANAGAAQGKTAIPGMPPYPGQYGDGSGPYGAAGKSADAYLKKSLLLHAAIAAESAGWTQAAKHLRHYLANSGDDLKMSPDELMRDVPQFRQAVDATTAKELKTIVAQAQANGTYGRPVSFTTKWKGFYVTEQMSKNWYFATAGLNYSVTGVATVQPPKHPGLPPRVEVDHRTQVFDRYNWDVKEGKAIEIGGVEIKDDVQAQLHRAGMAKEYNLVGSSVTKHYNGEIPHDSEFPLPQTRGGSRADPARG